MHSALLHAALAPARVSLPAVGPPDTLAKVCKPNPGIACRLVWDISHNTKAADLTTVFFAGPAQVIARIAFVLLIAVILRMAARRVIGRVTARAKENAARRADRTGSVFNERRNPRASALGSVLSNAATITIFGIATVIILGDMGVNLAPVLAGAGVLGIAIGFGAQNLVQDFLAGIFMLLEDQYGVGDVIAIGKITGTVEAVSFRITRLRDVNGVAWYVRNGTISEAGNESQGWARAVVDFPVTYDRDIPRVRQLMMHTATGMWQEPDWHGVILEEPEVWGVQSVSTDKVVVRLAARTAPLRQWEVARELRERLKTALDAASGDDQGAGPGDGRGAAVPGPAGQAEDGPAQEHRPAGDDSAADEDGPADQDGLADQDGPAGS